MKNVIDKNGKEIICGMDVEMPEPTSDDIWTVEGFVAMVDDILDNGNLIVSDQEGDFYEVEGKRVEIV